MLEKSDIKEIVDRVKEALEPQFAQIDGRLDGIDGRLSKVEMELRKTRIDIENRILPVINNMEEVYKTTFQRYIERTDKIDRIEMEQEVLKDIVADHTEQLIKLHAS